MHMFFNKFHITLFKRSKHIFQVNKYGLFMMQGRKRTKTLCESGEFM